MITAKEAISVVRNRTTIDPIIKEDEEFGEICTGIIQQVNKGWLCYNWGKPISKENSKSLESLGYTTDRDGFIYWLYSI